MKVSIPSFMAGTFTGSPLNMDRHVVGLLTEAQAATNTVPTLIPSTLNPPEPNEGVHVPESSLALSHVKKQWKL